MVYEEYAEVLETAWTNEGASAWDDIAPTDTGEITELLQEAHEQERERVAQELERLNEQLHERTAIHTDLIQELESDIERYEEALQEIFTLHGNRERVEPLKARIRELKQERRTEQRQQWRDRQELLADRREIHNELLALEDDLFINLLP